MNEYIKQYLTLSHWKNLWLDFWHALHTAKFWRELFIMTFGILLGAISIYYFLLPGNLIMGHVSGLCIVINTLLGGTPATLSLWVMALNAILLLLSFTLIGNEFGAKTVYTAMLLGPMIDLLDKVYPYTNFTHRVLADAPAQLLAQLQAGETVLDANGNPYLLSHSGEVLEQIRSTVMSSGLGTGDIWFDLVCFICILSASQALEFRINASTGGMDIVAKILNKYWHIEMGTAVAVSGIVICCSAFLINDYRLVIIGIIGTWFNGLVIDYFTAAFNKRKRVCIISEEYDRIRHYIIDDLVRGCSLYHVTGGYGDKEYIEIQTLLTQTEFASLMDFIRSNNIHAFTTAGNCSEVYGLWLKHKKHKGKVEIAPEE